MKFSVKDLRTLQEALHYGNLYQESFSDAYGHIGPESRKALKCAKKYEKLRDKILIEIHKAGMRRAE